MRKNIILITDGKPGHENISRGIIDTINRHYEVNIIIVNAKLRSSIFKRFITMLLNKSSIWQEKKLFIDIFYKNNDLPQKLQYDLIVSTGGATSFLNVMLSQYFKCPNIYCSSLRGLKYTLFTHLVSIDDHHYPNEIIVDTAPLVLDYNPIKVNEFKHQYGILETDSIWSVLIGGPTKDYPFSNDDFEKMILNIIKLARLHQSKLCITTSRRTPRSIETKLYTIFENENDLIKKYVLYNQNPEKVMRMFLAVSDKIFSTEDSGSMITEAVLSKKPVYTIRFDKANPRGIYKNFINRLIQKQNIVSVDIDKIPLITFSEPISILKRSPSETVYDNIRYLFLDNQNERKKIKGIK